MNPEASKVKRCLFGRPDHQELENDLKRELNNDAQEKNETWDFDFQKGKPLEGNKFEWKEVKPPNEAEEKTQEATGNQEMIEKKSDD